MGTIGTLGGYYQLSSLLSSGSGSSGASTATSALQQLENALFASSGSGNAASPGAYLLDLSPQAQSLLSSGASSGGGTSTKFSLTSAQEAQIKQILEKYKDAPLTQETFQKIQNDLQAAGLSPQTLAAEDQVKSFNPTNVLLQALNGYYGGATQPASTAAGEQTKETNYMQGVISLWKSLESSASSGSGASSASGISA